MLSNNGLSKPWLTLDKMTIIQRKHHLYNRVKQNAIPYSGYQAYSHTHGKIVDKAKVGYLKNTFQAYSINIRPTWKLTNIIPGKSKDNSHNSSINQIDMLITGDLQLANLFNNYLSQNGSELRQQLPVNVRDPLNFLTMLVENIELSVSMNRHLMKL